jgi:hypothetical protein
MIRSPWRSQPCLLIKRYSAISRDIISLGASVPLVPDLLRSNNNARITIDAGIGGTVNAFIMEDFSFGGRNDFNSAPESIFGDGMKKANSAAQVMVNGANMAGSSMISRTISGGDSVSNWIGSDRPRFALPMLFLALQPGNNPIAILQQMIPWVYPTGNPNGILYAPLNYVASFASSGSSRRGDES